MTQNSWNFIFSIFFLAVLGAVVYWLPALVGGYPRAVPPFDALLMALASFRITRLLVYDKIALWFRNLFAGSAEGTFSATVTDLLHCPWCVGFWGALVVAFCYFVFPWAWFVIFFLALAGAGSVLQVAANLVGWRAEQLKKTTERL